MTVKSGTGGSYRVTQGSAGSETHGKILEEADAGL